MCIAGRSHIGALHLLDWQVFCNQPLVGVVRGNGLLGGRDEVLVILFLSIDNFIKLFVEILKLSCFSHLIFQHELRRLQRAVATLAEKVETVVDKSLVEVHSPLSEEIPAMPNNFDATVRVIAIEAEENFMVGKDISLLHLDSLWCPSTLDCIVILL